jgi:HSP20 family molecular chaperone IbpA
MTDLTVGNAWANHFPSIFNTKHYDNFFESFFSPQSLDKVFETKSNYPPRTIKEIYDDNDVYKYTQLDYALSGFDKKDINISVEGNNLIIDIKKQDKEENKNEKIISSNMASRSIKQSWTLDSSTDTTNIESSFKDGLLSIKIYPKEEYHKQIEIK